LATKKDPIENKTLICRRRKQGFPRRRMKIEVNPNWECEKNIRNFEKRETREKQRESNREQSETQNPWQGISGYMVVINVWNRSLGNFFILF